MQKGLEMSENKNFSIKEANAFFVILAILFLTVGSYVQSRELITGLLITEFGLLAFPVLLYAIIRKKDFKNVFRIKKLPLSAMIKIVLMAALMLPAVAVANLVTILIIEFFGTPIPTPIPIASSPGEYVLLFAVIAGSAGLCEEIFFRGAILNGFESEVGKKWGAVFSGLLFGIFHFNPQNLLGPILLGIFFSYLVQLTGSIFAAVVAHVTNNGIAVTMGYIMNTAGDLPNVDMANDALLFNSPGVILGVMVFYGVLGTLFLFALRQVLRSLRSQFGGEPVWAEDALKINVNHYIPILFLVFIYGLITYIAYF